MATPVARIHRESPIYRANVDYGADGASEVLAVRLGRPGGLIYLLNELGNTLVVLRPEADGTLTEVQSVSTARISSHLSGLSSPGIAAYPICDRHC